MKIFMWSGPRNLSTALMRSFENREDTKVWDEPLYAYYLNETKKDHPLANEIINKYEVDIRKLIDSIIDKHNNKSIFYQKHMTHHILRNTPLDWIKSGINCLLIRDPKDVINSYIKKHKLYTSDDLGYPAQLKLFNIINKIEKKPIVINADNLSKNPKEAIIELCKKIKIPFDLKMLNWPLGKRQTDGLWEKVWYKNVQTSTKFDRLSKDENDIPKQYYSIYEECLEIYKKLNKYDILNGR